jgi:hypothetical protein
MGPYLEEMYLLWLHLDNDENVKYYLMQCTKIKMKLLEDYNDNDFIYEIGSIILKDIFFKKPMKPKVMFTFKTINRMS